jgi:hypothetical protein
MAVPARLPIPAAVVKIATKLEAPGYETWCVGRAVRDNLLGLENHDLDLTTGPPAETRHCSSAPRPSGSNTARSPCSIERTGRMKSPRFARTSAPTVGMPWPSSGCRGWRRSAPFFLGARGIRRCDAD